MHRAAALSSHELRVEDLLPRRSTLPYLERRPLAPATGVAEAAGPSSPASAPINLVDATLRELLRDAYRRHGSLRRAAAALGLPKSTFADRARRLGIL